MLTRQRVEPCCLQETRWRGGSARLIKANNSIYKFFWCGDQSGFGGVGTMLAEKWVNNAISVKRYDYRCYAPQSGLSAEEKDIFYERVFSVVASVPKEEMLILVVISVDMLVNTLQGSRVFMEVVGMV